MKTITIWHGLRMCIAWVLLLSSAQLRAAIPVGIPSDVLDDFQRWLGDRDVYTLTDFSGASSRRDVVEVALFLQALENGCSRRDVEWVQLDSYARTLATLREGHITATATSIWAEPFDDGHVALSPPVIHDGQFSVALYSRADRPLRVTSVTDLARYSVVSSQQWRHDWETLQRLPFRQRDNVDSWDAMLRWVASGRADMLLAPMRANDQGLWQQGDVSLRLVPSIRVVVPGSRHYGFYIHEPAGARLAACFSRGLYRMRESGVINRAFVQSGFWHPAFLKWPEAVLAPESRKEPELYFPLPVFSN